MNYCTHYECRLETAQELAAMADALPSRHAEFIAKAAGVFELEVRCRHVPGRGLSRQSPQAPLPGKPDAFLDEDNNA